MIRPREIFKIAANLVIVYLVGGAVLAVVYALTSPVIFQNREAARQVSLRKLVPQAEKVEKIGSWKRHDKNGDLFVARRGGLAIGYVAQSFGKGYGGALEVFVAVDTNFAVTRTEVLSHLETPGIGDWIEDEKMRARVVGKDAAHLKVVKQPQPGFVDAVSGATITSRAFVEDAVKGGVMELQTRVAGGKR